VDGFAAMIAYEKHSETSKPSPDKGDVTKWIIAPSWLAGFWGTVAGIGIAMAVVANHDAVFVIGIGMFGGGSAALATITLKSLSFDRDGVVSMSTETPIIYDQPDAPGDSRGIRSPIYVAKREGAQVDYNRQSYQFTSSQINAMFTRAEAEAKAGQSVRTVARDPFGITGTDYPQVQYIMAGLDYWKKQRNGIEWTNSGLAWLEAQARAITPPPAQ
jgi:hypothetical protein